MSVRTKTAAIQKHKKHNMENRRKYLHTNSNLGRAGLLGPSERIIVWPWKEPQHNYLLSCPQCSKRLSNNIPEASASIQRTRWPRVVYFNLHIGQLRGNR